MIMNQELIDKIMSSVGKKGIVFLFIFSALVYAFAGEGDIEWQLVKRDYVLTGGWSIPAFVDIDADGDYDLFVGNLYSKEEESPVVFFRNIGTKDSPSFEKEETEFFDPPLQPRNWDCPSPALGDIDADGDFDLFLGSCVGIGGLYRNIGGPKKPRFREAPQPSLDFIFKSKGSAVVPFLADIDGDGDLDLFASRGTMHIYFFRNEGTKEEPLWKLITDDYTADIIGKGRLGEYVTFTDIDNDGDYDMFATSSDDAVHYFRNDGTPESPKWTLATKRYNPIDLRYPMPAFVDIDADGEKEMFIGTDEGEVSFWDRVP